MSTPSIALVTGASRGIGAAIAQALAEQGHKVFGTATTPEGAERIGAALSPWGGHGVALNVNEAGVAWSRSRVACTCW